MTSTDGDRIGVTVTPRRFVTLRPESARGAIRLIAPLADSGRGVIMLRLPPALPTGIIPDAVPCDPRPAKTPMSEPAVNWHEGMFLRPHHFQAAGRYLNDQLRQSGRWDVHYNWGLRAIDIDADALHNYQFVVHRLEARLRDGTIIRIPEDGARRQSTCGPVWSSTIRSKSASRYRPCKWAGPIAVRTPTALGFGSTRRATACQTRIPVKILVRCNSAC